MLIERTNFNRNTIYNTRKDFIYEKMISIRNQVKRSEPENSENKECTILFGKKMQTLIDISGNEALESIAQKRAAQIDNCPYAEMIDPETGVISYHGVVFVPDSQKNAICLGDMNNEDNILTIPLSKGGSLRVNRNNIDQLGKAINMFSPEDIRRIMEAISLDAKVQKEKAEIEESKFEVGRKMTASNSSERKTDINSKTQPSEENKKISNAIENISWDMKQTWKKAKISYEYQEELALSFHKSGDKKVGL